MSVPREVRELVERFRRNEDVYRSSQYNETQLRREFIDPFFTALGWDVANVQGYAEAYKDVVHEDAIKVGGATKAPDYCFRIGGTRKFFVEAKRPAVQIKDDAASAYQLRRYAWSAKLPLSILTNFAEFAVYDCRIKPDKKDPASKARVLYLTYEEYASRWDELAGVFAKEAVYKGSFDRYAESTKRKRGTAEVDAAFLKEIEGWREKLARNIALRNPELSQHELNFAVQRTIDRIIFLRICEDRGVEEYGRLMALLNGPRVYPRLVELFHQADERYNSGLFHFRREKGRAEPPDELTPALVIDDKVLKDIIRQLYYPDSPYEFSVLPTHILGQVYEQFLGKVIRLTPAHRAKVEEKPEVRKAGGVFYTPTYIVDYIVKHTVGKLLEGKTPQEVGGLTKNWRPSKRRQPLRILDPACGSGSFLLGAYQYLLDWYRDRYVEDGPEKHAKCKHPRLFRGPGGEWRLTTAERKRILLTHIYGVDIDPQAVEVTKLSLLLKVLEGETEETLDRQLKLFHERALPDLGRNIKCGNSLIGPDFYETAEAAGLDREELLRVNPFDWHTEFPEVFQAGGFDAVIGNPPYIDSEWMTLYLPEHRTYCTARYKAATGNWDIFCVFIERALQLSRPGGLVSMIVPNKLLSASYAAGARRVLTAENRLIRIRDYSRMPVFPVAVYPIVFVAKKESPKPTDHVEYELLGLSSTGGVEPVNIAVLGYELFVSPSGYPWPTTSSTASTSGFVERLRRSFPPLGSVAEVSGGATVSEAYKIQSLIRESETKKRVAGALALVNTGTIDRYVFLWGIKPFQYLGKRFVRPIVMKGDLIKLLPRRAQQAMNPKIVVAGMSKRLECAVDLEGGILAAKSTSIIFSPSLHLQYLIGILNSKLISFYFASAYSGNRLAGGYMRVGPPQLRTVPLAWPVDSADKARHDKMVELVQRMLDLHEQLAAAKTEHEKTVLQRQIAVTDRQIDQLVYELYGLTEKEISIVEEAMS